jgi:hypothetical protein
MKALALFIFILSSLLAGCAGESEPEPVHCKADSLVQTPAGERLLIICSGDVENPPATCERQSEGRYACNIYHASQADCEAFPGMCEAPQ